MEADFAAAAKTPSRIYAVVYEKLVGAPEQNIHALCAFLKVNTLSALADRVFTSDFLVSLPNQIRHRAASTLHSVRG